jgi:hypothetical protein
MPENRGPATFPGTPRAALMVLTWPATPVPSGHVRMADITGKSHLPVVPRLALDTCRRNGHASDQAHVTVLRTLVRSREPP